jgi:hypothetical protein
MRSALAKRDVVDVAAIVFFEQGQQFVLGSVKTVHAGVGFCPHDQSER